MAWDPILAGPTASPTSLTLLHGDRGRSQAAREPAGPAPARRPIADRDAHRAAFCPAHYTGSSVRFWSARMFDWRQTRFFALPSDVGGLVRINLQGREPEGIVRQGAEFDGLCDELVDALCSLEDVETGEPIIAAVDRTDRRGRVRRAFPARPARPHGALGGATARRLDRRAIAPLRRARLGARSEADLGS